MLQAFILLLTATSAFPFSDADTRWECHAPALGETGCDPLYDKWSSVAYFRSSARTNDPRFRCCREEGSGYEEVCTNCVCDEWSLNAEGSVVVEHIDDCYKLAWEQETYHVEFSYTPNSPHGNLCYLHSPECESRTTRRGQWSRYRLARYNSLVQTDLPPAPTIDGGQLWRQSSKSFYVWSDGCAENCARCGGPGPFDCLTCAEGYFQATEATENFNDNFDAGVCFVTYGNCAEGCVGCNGPEPTDCVLCAEGWGFGREVCEEGNAATTRRPHEQSDGCAVGCAECDGSGHRDCVTCAEGYTMQRGLCRETTNLSQSEALIEPEQTMVTTEQTLVHGFALVGFATLLFGSYKFFFTTKLTDQHTEL